MSLPEIWILVPGAPGASILLWVLILSFALYVARTPAHNAISSFSTMLFMGFRLVSRAVTRAENRLARRNREVLFAAGEETAGRIVEREFERVSRSVERDLGEYPVLQRRLGEHMARIDEDYQASAELPSAPGQWIQAIEAVAQIPAASDSAIATVLGDINNSMERSQREALEEYRAANRKRHQLLRRILPYWRAISRTLEAMNQNVESILERSRRIDRHMDEFEEIQRKTPQAERMLFSSSLIQFFVAGLVLVIAVGGLIINFNLISRPMQEIVGASSYIVGAKAADVTALVIILLEVTMGLFLTECLRITRFFPVIGALDDRMRVRLAWVSVFLLLFLASVQAGLAYMREPLSQDDAALIAELVQPNGADAENPNQWVTMASQMGMGFVLPFALTFIAIPLESFLRASRTLIGVLALGILRVLAVVLRLLANTFRLGGQALNHLYDVLIFMPLWIERLAARRRGDTASAVGDGNALGRANR